jgi:hypothetical protein
MTFAQRSKGESHQKTSEWLREDVCPMLLHRVNVRGECDGASALKYRSNEKSFCRTETQCCRTEEIEDQDHED